MDEERDVGGLRCSQVLEGLSAYVDGELPPETIVKVEAHLAACENCAHFGAAFGEALGRLHTLRPNANDGDGDGDADADADEEDRTRVLEMLERVHTHHDTGDSPDSDLN